MSRPRLQPEQLSLGFAIFLVQLAAFAEVDTLEMFIWAGPQIDELRIAFYQSREPAENFPLWLRVRYLAREAVRS